MEDDGWNDFPTKTTSSNAVHAAGDSALPAVQQNSVHMNAFKQPAQQATNFGGAPVGNANAPQPAQNGNVPFAAPFKRTQPAIPPLNLSRIPPAQNAAAPTSFGGSVMTNGARSLPSNGNQGNPPPFSVQASKPVAASQVSCENDGWDDPPITTATLSSGIQRNGSSAPSDFKNTAPASKPVDAFSKKGDAWGDIPTVSVAANSSAANGIPKSGPFSNAAKSVAPQSPAPMSKPSIFSGNGDGWDDTPVVSKPTASPFGTNDITKNAQSKSNGLHESQQKVAVPNHSVDTKDDDEWGLGSDSNAISKNDTAKSQHSVPPSFSAPSKASDMGWNQKAPSQNNQEVKSVFGPAPPIPRKNQAFGIPTNTQRNTGGGPSKSTIPQFSAAPAKSAANLNEGDGWSDDPAVSRKVYIDISKFTDSPAKPTFENKSDIDWGVSPSSASFQSKPATTAQLKPLPQTTSSADDDGWGVPNDVASVQSKPATTAHFKPLAQTTSSADDGWGVPTSVPSGQPKPATTAHFKPSQQTMSSGGDDGWGESTSSPNWSTSGSNQNSFNQYTTANSSWAKSASGDSGFGKSANTSCSTPNNGGFSGFKLSGASRSGFGEDGAGSSSACRKCGQEGHCAKECPGGGDRGCFNCGKEGHQSKECPEPKKPREGVTCRNCDQPGHFAKDCTESKREGQRPPASFEPEDPNESTLFTDTIDKGALYDKLYTAKISVTRRGLEPRLNSDVIKSFDDSGLSDTIMQNLVRLGYTKPTPIQQAAMPIISAGCDLMACAQTGSGKTAAYLLPIIAKLSKDGDLSNAAEERAMPRCLVIGPTRELVVQIEASARKFGNNSMLTAQSTYGGQAVNFNRQKLMQGVTILAATCGRLLQFLNEGVISLAKLRFLVLDEADRMMEANSFLEEVKKIIEMIPNKDSVQTLMFSATFPTSVQTAAQELLKSDYMMVTVGIVGAANECITQNFVQCSKSTKFDKLLELLQCDLEKNGSMEFFSKKTLIFVQRKAFADTLGTYLSENDLPSITIHADRDQAQRREALDLFKSGRRPILIATAVAERGLDIRGVDHVINFDLPQDIDAYVQRIGRTGRVGNTGVATSFFGDNDTLLAPELKRILQDAGQIVPDFIEQLTGGESMFGNFTSNNAQPVANPVDEEW